MAIGLGQMFGFHFEENFNYPYISKTVSEFWRRWPISMQTWFRDYVYFPMGGSRVSKPRVILNLFVVWLLTGMWHGDPCVIPVKCSIPNIPPAMFIGRYPCIIPVKHSISYIPPAIFIICDPGISSINSSIFIHIPVS